MKLGRFEINGTKRLGVFEEDPIYAPRPEARARLPVARPLEGVEGVRLWFVLVAGGEVGVHETTLDEAAVDGRAGAAVEVSREDYGRFGLQELFRFAEYKPAALHAGCPAHVVEVGVDDAELASRVPVLKPHPVRKT